MSYAREEAIKLVSWILGSLGSEESLCLELPFLDVRRKADLAILSPTRLAAIEVKGARDNTAKLEEQLKDYLSMFLEVTVASAPNHLARVRKIAPQSVGIAVLNGTGVELLRKPRTRRLLSKMSAAAWLGRQDLDQLVGRTTVRQLGVEGSRIVACERHSAEALTKAALTALSHRNKERFNAFLSERGRVIDLDDIRLLSLQSKVRQ